MAEVVAVAGVGDLGRYVCEELLASPSFDVVVLTRQVSISIITSSLISRIYNATFTLKPATQTFAVVHQSRLAGEQRCPSLPNRLYRPFDPLNSEQHFRDNTHLLYLYPRHQIYHSPLRDPNRLSTIIDLQAPDPLRMDRRRRGASAETRLLRNDARTLSCYAPSAGCSHLDTVQRWMAGGLFLA